MKSEPLMSQVLESYVHLITTGKIVDVGEWQSIEAPGDFFEVLDVNLKLPMPVNVDDLSDSLLFHSNPWAEDHFQERVSGEPLNPGDQYLNWPYYTKSKIEDKFKGDNKFSHTYMERMNTPPLQGIRFTYGNLWNLVDLLARQPFTRQAYLPIFFPEDTGCHHGKRVPCTLGYLFMRRENQLHMWYYARSIDALYHFEDDIYLAIRLAHWLLYQLRESKDWVNVYPGNFHFNIANFHCFNSVKQNVVKRIQAYDRV